MPVLEVKAIEPAALSPDGAGEYLSLTKRQIYNLIADGFLIAKRSGARTLVDFASVKSYYEGLPLKTVAASIPNSPQCTTPARRRRRASADASSGGHV
jgi:excisionase family DNA binding protein